jgi:lysophospholipase L1-like esterase
MSINYGRKKKRIIFFGDSLTSQGNDRNGYITRIKNFLKQEDQEDKFELIASGIDGNKVPDLYRRIDEDVLFNGAELVVIFIGVNDVWHKQSGKGTDAEEFQTLYDAIIQKLLAAEIKVIVCTIPVIGEKVDNGNEFDEDINKYCGMIRTVATTNNLPVADLRKTFLEYNLINNFNNLEAGILTTDGVHLNDKGNELVAEEMWKAIEQLIINKSH